jgi:WS/DGAT/MGAT family acyltransferase
MVDQREVFMRESDAFTLRMERDPVLRSTIVSVAWLAESPDWERLVERLERATRAVPPFRMVVVEPPAQVATPRWVASPGFDLSWHLRRIDAPAPHTPAAVVDFARGAAMTAFDPARPLWEFTLVDHVVGGGAALVMKVHHALTDGIGGMELAPLLFDTGPAPAPPAEDTPVPPSEHLTQAGLLRESVAHVAGRLFGLIRHEAAAAVPAALRAARHPMRTAGDVVATAGSIARTVAPVTDTLSPVMTERSLGRYLDMLSMPLSDLKAAGRAGQGTVNDAFLAAVTGGLARYHERHGAAVDELRVTLPISIRTEADPIGGNRITLQRFTVPVGVGDTAERMRAIEATIRAVRGEPSLPHTDAIAGVLNLLPSGVVGEMLKHVDFLASNVPGVPFPVHLAGAEVVGLYAWGPTIGASVNTTLLSYNGTCCVGVTIDTAAVPDPDLLVACLHEGFEEVLALGGAHDRVLRPLAAGSFLGGSGEPGDRRSGSSKPARPARPAKTARTAKRAPPAPQR